MLTKLISFVFAASISISSVFAIQNDQPHLYFFTSPNCGPCKQVEPEIQALISKNYPVTVVDINQRPDIARQFNVNRTPVTLLVAGDKVVGRRPGLIDAYTIVGWFNSVNSTQRPTQRTSQPTRVAQPRPNNTPLRNAINNSRPNLNLSSISNTVHRGTRQPNSEAEFNAMRASVRLKVEDPGGVSIASGTVIHSSNGECLVMTCGHVFRDAQGTGTITAELGFETNETRSFPGRLVSYDAGPKDIGLVIVETGFDIPAIPVAPPGIPIQKGDQVFTIGCDHGDDATIRRTRIKNQALYNSAKKYDIYGRPVDGRSGGGLFTAGGQLIGVCNAAAVEVDEGVYTSLENIYWQLAKVNLTHLFDGSQAIATQTPKLRGTPVVSEIAGTPRRATPLQTPVQNFTPNFGGNQPKNSDMQIIVVLQSKSSPDQAETLVINDPSPELIAELRARNAGNTGLRSDRLAELRREMPRLNAPSGSRQYRAQSPR